MFSFFYIKFTNVFRMVPSLSVTKMEARAMQNTITGDIKSTGHIFISAESISVGIQKPYTYLFEYLTFYSCGFQMVAVSVNTGPV